MKRPPPLSTPRPPRTRRPAVRTLLLKFLLLLVAGAAVNVAVASGCASTEPRVAPTPPEAELGAATTAPASPIAQAEATQQEPASARVAPTVLATAEMVDICLSPDEDMFPPEWLKPPSSIVVDELAAEEGERSRRIIARAIAKYPASVLQGNLQRIYVIGGLRFRGVSANGTNALATVYVVNSGAADELHEAFVEGFFHHEFSSILMRNHSQSFPLIEWNAVNPKGFEYIGGGVMAIKAGKATGKGSAELVDQGFLVDYCQASVEEDFNVIAQKLFANTERFWRWADRSPRLNTKIELAIQFYHAVDPMFTKEYFRSLPRCAN